MSANVLSAVMPTEYEAGLAYAADNAEALVNTAREIRLDSLHYNGFYVGAVAVATGAGLEPDELKTYNDNRFEGTNPTKRCAEQKILKKMEPGYDKITAYFTCGPTQPDTQSGLITPVLHSCGECRHALSKSEAVDEATLMIHLHPEQPIYDIYTFGELETLHEAGLQPRNELPYYYDPGFKRLGGYIRMYASLAAQNYELEKEDDISLEI